MLICTKLGGTAAQQPNTKPSVLSTKLNNEHARVFSCTFEAVKPVEDTTGLVTEQLCDRRG